MLVIEESMQRANAGHAAAAGPAVRHGAFTRRPVKLIDEYNHFD